MNLFLQMDNDVEQPPSPSSSSHLAPSPASTCFSPAARSFSGYSSVSSQSSYSNDSTLSKGTTGSTSTTASKRRGYVRPQGAIFAPSAKNRESVMSLGSIAHLQYYFARTGLLDGRSGQMAKKKESGGYDIPTYRSVSVGSQYDSPIDEEGEMMWEAAKEEGEDVMLPPTVSTYRSRPDYVASPPSQQTLKRELVYTLENALHSLEALEKANRAEDSPTQGFYQLQGMQILDTTTLAIRAAKQYYVLHPNPKRLALVKPDQELRKELYDILEVLKKAAARNFAGGLRDDERLAVLVWVSDVGMVIDREARLEEADKKQRRYWRWLDDSLWTPDDRDREMDFLDFLQKEAGADTQQSTTRLDRWSGLLDGQQLIRMHNAAVKNSKKQFGFIEKCHEDNTKPYRRAENLRFWLKGAELRFETKLRLDVAATVTAHPTNEAIKAFEECVLTWARAVRLDLGSDWDGEEERKLHARAKSLALASPMGSPLGSPKKSSGKRRGPLVLDVEDDDL